MQNNISYNSRVTLNKNKIFIMKDNQNLQEIISKFIKIDEKYDKILKEIGKNINKKKVEHIDIMINLPAIGNCMIKVFVVNNLSSPDDLRELGINIHNYTIANGISDFDLIAELNGEGLFNVLEGIFIMNYKYTHHIIETGGNIHVNYNISLLGRSMKEKSLMQMHLKILEDMINKVGNKMKNMPKTSIKY